MSYQLSNLVTLNEVANRMDSDCLKFFQHIASSGVAKVIIVDELGVTAEMNLSNFTIEVSPLEYENVNLECHGPIEMHYPEGVEPF